MKKKILKVVAAVIENKDQEILCALRSPEMSLPNLWELPGGKVEANEDIYSALEREIEEELGCRIKAEAVFNENVHEYKTFIVHLVAIKSQIIDGIPLASEHAKLLWLKRENLDSLRWADADIPAVEKLRKEASQ